MKKACCFTNFKLSRAHVIHIYKTCEKPFFSYFFNCLTEGTEKNPIFRRFWGKLLFILFQLCDGRYKQKDNLDPFWTPFQGQRTQTWSDWTTNHDREHNSEQVSKRNLTFNLLDPNQIRLTLRYTNIMNMKDKKIKTCNTTYVRHWSTPAFGLDKAKL